MSPSIVFTPRCAKRSAMSQTFSTTKCASPPPVKTAPRMRPAASGTAAAPKRVTAVQAGVKSSSAAAVVTTFMTLAGSIIRASFKATDALRLPAGAIQSATSCVLSPERAMIFCTSAGTAAANGAAHPTMAAVMARITFFAVFSII